MAPWMHGSDAGADTGAAARTAGGAAVCIQSCTFRWTAPPILPY